jgi:hypothetical protein
LKEHIQNIDIMGFIDFSDDIRKINIGKASALDIEAKPVEQMKAFLTQAGWVLN